MVAASVCHRGQPGKTTEDGEWMHLEEWSLLLVMLRDIEGTI